MRQLCISAVQRLLNRRRRFALAVHKHLKQREVQLPVSRNAREPVLTVAEQFQHPYPGGMAASALRATASLAEARSAKAGTPPLLLCRSFESEPLN